MKIKYIGKGSYYHHPFLFNRERNTHEVTEEIGVALLGQPKLFKEVPSPKKETQKGKIETDEDEVEDTELEDKKKKNTKK